jgi:eukaryotic-like serine/threonine-protein kinase
MSPDRWKKIEAIFTAALSFEADEREAFIQRACGDDFEMRRQVIDMLAHDENPESFPGTSVFGLLEDSSEYSSADTNISRQIGVYRLVKELGRGGMGAVYLAERADHEFRHQVAIKLIKRGMDTDLVLKRFRRERQMLADLNYPNIARLLDGGTTEDGLPYFVMEYIEGQSILEYCNERRLTLKERLRLFLQACSAVRFAHQKTIVHRDIKPGNILVSNDGTVKLLDFGIAKILGGDETTEMTHPALQPLTPKYASPEHLQGFPVTPVSDIYSLGVLLYELLTDHYPYSIKTNTRSEVTRIISNSKAEKPSEIIFTERNSASKSQKRGKVIPETVSANRRMSIDELQAELEGDLDSIVLKAIEKSPDFRHQSVDELIKEIELYLEGKKAASKSTQISLSTESRNIQATTNHLTQNKQLQKSETTADFKKSLSPRQLGIRQSVVLMMVGAVGTPLIAFLSLEFGLKPTWTLFFAVLTIFGGILRLGYALAFEESDSGNKLIKGEPEPTLQINEKETQLLNEQPASPGDWMKDTTYSIQEQKNPDKK